MYVCVCVHVHVCVRVCVHVCVCALVSEITCWNKYNMSLYLQVIKYHILDHHGSIFVSGHNQTSSCQNRSRLH